ncbi:uncharacterized protein PFL1_00929 [Pseudozyma flocculosa PF-1]|uniref:uncharacterized protein n=1 Tax=Pseudozyma flocculosa PF-1 TaxID=1277687 RepID=UPI00045600A5|nr:uncharacterized protein PFL1_00929 [Pseudozyma flocculosa PF-1]EPQ31596.1 hypothetical protein PFL1_00929 [Pseudozyma flocculosa PF-1]
MAGTSTTSPQDDETTTPPPQQRRNPGLRLPRMTKVSRRAGANDGDAAPSDDDDDDDDDFARWKAASGPTTPNLSETAAQLKRSLSVTGLQDLAHMPPGQLRKQVGSKVWRPQDEEARMPGDWERLLVHVVRGGLRAGNLAFALRATLMLVLELIKAIRTKRFKGRSLGLAVLGPTNFRFAGLFALWAALYKATHNSLRLLTPMPVDSGTATPRSGRAALEGKTDSEKAHERSKQKRRAFMRDPRSKVWHAYLAGAVSALAVLVETPANRIALAQQLFVRGLEGSYNVAHSKGLVNVPHGAVLCFGLACGQIMHAWLTAPDSLPGSYRNWITRASQVTPVATTIHRDIIQRGTADLDLALKLFPNGEVPKPYSLSPLRYPHVPPNAVNRRGIHGKNVKKIVEWMERAKKGDVGHVIDCALVHPWEASHLWSPVDRFFEVTRWILPVYLTLHFVPAMFLRPGSFLKDPMRAFLRSLFGSVRSSSFLGVFVIIYQTIFCALHSSHGWLVNSPTLKDRVPAWLLKLLLSSEMKWLAGFATCGSLFIEHSRRRAELAAYVLPKGMESAWSIARKRAWVPFVPGGDLLLTSMGMSLVMGTYAQNPEHLSGLVRRVVYQFVGRN